MESILSFKCVVGDTSCIYKDKKSLAQGKMTPKAKTVLSKKLVKAKMPKATIKPKAKIASKPPGAKNLIQTKASTGLSKKKLNLTPKKIVKTTPAVQNKQKSVV